VRNRRGICCTRITAVCNDTSGYVVHKQNSSQIIWLLLSLSISKTISRQSVLLNYFLSDINDDKLMYVYDIPMSAFLCISTVNRERLL